MRRGKLNSFTRICWEDFDMFVGTKITPTDIDGMFIDGDGEAQAVDEHRKMHSVERNGHFLITEFKQAGVKMPKGQEIYYRNMMRSFSSYSALAIVEHAARRYTYHLEDDMPEPVNGIAMNPVEMVTNVHRADVGSWTVYKQHHFEQRWPNCDADYSGHGGDELEAIVRRWFATVNEAPRTSHHLRVVS